MNAPTIGDLLLDQVRVKRIPTPPPPPAFSVRPRRESLRDGWSRASSCPYEGCDCPADHD